ncbi:MAG: type II secretion system major pseudopilin GspG [Victivallales bacterium]|jgi:general secretion pathway protein G|nr:type II secretion system major pseudopilin GspG [Victivallales bacterium]
MSERQSLRRRRRYFSLIEIMVVVVIIGLISGIVGVNVIGHIGRARTNTAKSEVASLKDAVRTFYFDIGTFPRSLDELVRSPGSDKWDGPYLDRSTVPKDPWGQDYHYDYPGQHGEFDVYSYGRDNSTGGRGVDQDILSWE